MSEFIPRGDESESPDLDLETDSDRCRVIARALKQLEIEVPYSILLWTRLTMRLVKSVQHFIRHSFEYSAEYSTIGLFDLVVDTK